MGTLAFKESICQVLRQEYTYLMELFTMKNFSILQVHVLKNIAQTMGSGTSNPEINEFLKSATGIAAMKAYREVLIKKFGDAGRGMPNTDDQVNPGFNPENTEAHENLVKSLSNEVINIIKN